MSLHKLTAAQQVLKGPFDLFVCSASYEKRCRVIADAINPSTIASAAIARNENFGLLLNENPEYLAERFIGCAQELAFDTDNPLKTADALWNLFSRFLTDSPKKVLIDVSTFTHEALLIILRSVQTLARPNDTFEFVYVPAEEYSLGDENKDKWLSKGIREIRSVLGYPGELLPSRRIHLIVLVGFETERARALIDAYEPSLLSLGYATEETSTSKLNFQANEHFHQSMISVFPKANSFSFAANDFGQTAAVLINEVKKNAGFNTVIAPLNTKISTIGCGIAAIQNPAIQLCYAQAELYNCANYSSAADSFNHFSWSPLVNSELT